MKILERKLFFTLVEWDDGQYTISNDGCFYCHAGWNKREAYRRWNEVISR